MMFKKIYYIIIVSLLSTSLSYAKNNVYIYATVNDKIITNFDIKKEINYLKILNPKLLDLNDKQVFELSKISLINELIKKSEIQKFLNFDKENSLVSEYIKNLYTELGFNNEKDFELSLSKKNDYSLEEIKEKLKIEIMWNELVYLRYNKQVKIDKNSFLKKIKDLENKVINEYLLSEIVFEKNKNEEYEKTVQKIKSSINEIGFKNTANLFSVSNSGRSGGNIGWVSEHNLSDQIFENLKGINVGEYTNIIQIGNNFLILKIENKREKKISINKDKELNKMITFETNKQLNQFSRIFFNKTKINYSINEK